MAKLPKPRFYSRITLLDTDGVPDGETRFLMVGISGYKYFFDP